MLLQPITGSGFISAAQPHSGDLGIFIHGIVIGHLHIALDLILCPRSVSQQLGPARSGLANDGIGHLLLEVAGADIMRAGLEVKTTTTSPESSVAASMPFTEPEVPL